MKFTRLIKTIGIAALAACLLVGAQAPASALDYQQCTSNWEDSSASDYCPNASIRTESKRRTTCVVNVFCSVTVSVDGDKQTISGPVSANTSSAQSLKLCIRRSADDLRWDLRLAGFCGSSTDAATAVENGLTTN